MPVAGSSLHGGFTRFSRCKHCELFNGALSTQWCVVVGFQTAPRYVYFWPERRRLFWASFRTAGFANVIMIVVWWFL